MNILEKLMQIVAPFSCLGCGNEGSVVCAGCRDTMCQPLPPRCYRCHASNKLSATCAACRRHTALRHVWVCSAYEGLVKDLVYKLKFERTRAAAVPIAENMHGLLPRYGRFVVVPVPTATNRVRERGYDQAELVARSLASCRTMPYVCALRRLGRTRQLGAKRLARQQQLLSAYRVSRPHLVRNQHILLVDDVMTTGATLEAAAMCLRRAGAASVSAIVFAHKQ